MDMPLLEFRETPYQYDGSRTARPRVLSTRSGCVVLGLLGLIVVSSELARRPATATAVRGQGKRSIPTAATAAVTALNTPTAGGHVGATHTAQPLAGSYVALTTLRVAPLTKTTDSSGAAS